MTEQEFDVCLKMVVAANRMSGFLDGGLVGDSIPDKYRVDLDKATEDLTELISKKNV